MIRANESLFKSHFSVNLQIDDIRGSRGHTSNNRGRRTMAETVVEAQRSLLMMFAIYWKKIKIEIMRNGPRELIACEKAYECALNAETSKNRLEMLLKRSIDLIGDNGHLILMEKNETDPENEMSQIR